MWSLRNQYLLHHTLKHQIILIVVAANRRCCDRHLSQVMYICRLRTRVGSRACTICRRVHVRILILPRQLLACLLALVVAWLPCCILTHIHVHCHAAAHKLLTRIFLFRMTDVLSMLSDLSKIHGYQYLECNCSLNTCNRDSVRPT